jgi:hypothetical protein
MSLLPRFGLRRHREEEALRERVSALQAALDGCKGAARRWTELRLSLVTAVVVAALGAGFLLGAHTGPQPVANLLTAVGITRQPPDGKAAEAAYQKGDYANALKIAQPLAEQGDERAQQTLGLIYYRGRGVTADHHEAVKWFRRAANRGNASAQFYLGLMFAEGQGVPQDYAEAAKWYRFAADSGDAQAQYNLGLAYVEGEGVEADNVAAHMWFNIAAARFPPSDTRNRSAAVKNRDVVAAKMTPDQIAEAQRLARAWRTK